MRIAADLRRQILGGALRPGDRLPSIRQLVRDHGVAMATASRVIATLRQEGLAETVTGVGTVVAAATDGRAPHRRDGPARSDADAFLSRIVATATAIADAEGLAATGMRRIATELEVATMVLYRHVRSREHLMTLMADAAFAAHRPPARPPAGWRAQLELICRLQWSMYRRHPWLAQVVSLTRPLLAPNAIAHTEWTMRAVADRGLDHSTLIHLAAMVANFVRGTAINLEREAETEQDTGLTDDEWMNMQGEALTAALRSGSFPIMASLSSRDDVDLSIDSLFEFALQRLLDSVALLLASRQREEGDGRIR